MPPKNTLRRGASCGFIVVDRPVESGFIFREPAILAQLGAWQRVVNRKRMHILYSGNVQGVGFRYTVKSVATGFEVTGTVRNLPDGRVELLAEGSKEELEAFRQGIRDSGMEHFIRNEEISWSGSKNEFRGFEIVR